MRSDGASRRGEAGADRRRLRVGENETIRVDGHIKERENRYYKKVAERFRTTGFILLFLLVLFGGVMLVRYREYITYGNFVYLFRDFGSVAFGSDGKYSEITYNSQENMVFEPFRDGFALVGTTSVSVYDKTGVEVCSGKEGFSYPAAETSDKYLLAYDVGGEEYSIYNSITRIVTKKTEFPIITASVSDEGSYIITTESDKAKYVTELYSSALRRKMSIYKEKYVIDSAIDRDGKAIVIASVDDSGTGFAAEVAFYLSGLTDAVAVKNYQMAMPISVESLKNGVFAVLFDDALRIYSDTGEVLLEKSFGGAAVTGFDITRNRALVVCRENGLGTVNRVYLFDGDGNVLLDTVVDTRITSAAAALPEKSRACYVRVTDGILGINEDGSCEKIDFTGEILDITDTEGGTLVCTPTAAHPIDKSKD